MLYLISDIHGNLQDFKQILKKIALCTPTEQSHLVLDLKHLPLVKDYLYFYQTLYILDDSMKLLIGNHELFAIMYLNGVLGEEYTKDVLSERTWALFGGEETINVVKKMSTSEKKELLYFLKRLPLYAEINSRYLGDVIVTHTGIDCTNYQMNSDSTINVRESIENAFEKNRYDFMIGMDLHQIPMSDKARFDKYLIVGHVPCYRLNDDMSNKFYRTPYYMDIDAGAGHKKQGGTLGCYCVTTDKEIYI